MAATTVRTRPDHPQAPAPVHADGTPYRYEMVHGGGAKRTYADTSADLVAALIPGYADLQDPVELARARIVHAVHVQVTTQASINVALGTAACSAPEREVLGADRTAPPVLAQWSAPVPLVLLDCFYAPVTDVPRPVALAPGEIRWLRPATDRDHLRSLAGLGVIMVAEHAITTAGPACAPTPGSPAAPGPDRRPRPSGPPGAPAPGRTESST